MVTYYVMMMAMYNLIRNAFENNIIAVLDIDLNGKL